MERSFKPNTDLIVYIANEHKNKIKSNGIVISTILNYFGCQNNYKMKLAILEVQFMRKLMLPCLFESVFLGFLLLFGFFFGCGWVDDMANIILQLKYGVIDIEQQLKVEILLLVIHF